MKQSVVLLAILGLTLAATCPARAAVVTFRFDPNDLLDLFPATVGDEDVAGENKATQENARRVHEVTASTFYETFHNPADPHAQPNDYNTYVNWLDGLTKSGEGIKSFNMWMANNAPVRSWGETLVTAPNSAVIATADAGNGWYVEMIVNPWDSDSTLVRWYTNDPDNYLRPGGTDLDEFTFTVDVYVDDDQNGWDSDDPGATVGETYRVWFGSQNGQESDPDNTGAIFFDADDWGTLSSTVTPFASVLDPGNLGSGWEGTLELNAHAVPEASTILVWTLLTGLAVVASRRKR